MIKDTRLRILTTIGLGGNNSSKKPAAMVRPEDAILMSHASDSEFKIDFGIRSRYSESKNGFEIVLSRRNRLIQNKNFFSRNTPPF